jgi:glycosyltransferase involved in cell wall biosynthesis
MSNHTPVISSNTGGLPEVNENGISGFTSDVGNIEEMSSNAIHILEDDQRLEQFKNAAFANAEKFDITLVIPKYEELYERALSKSRAIKND